MLDPENLLRPNEREMSGKQKRRTIGESRVVIAVPLAGHFIYWKVVAALLELERPPESDLMVSQGALIDRARNHLVQQMLDHPIGATHLFFLDADILPSSDTLMVLLRHQRPIVSALYRKRLYPHEPMAFMKKGDKIVPISGKKRGLASANLVGAGCLLIERQVFEKIKPPWFESTWKGKKNLSEDFSFCEKAKKAGFTIDVDMSVTPLHLEPVGIGTNAQGDPQLVSVF